MILDIGDWIMGVLLGLDQLGGAIIGTPDETISSMAGRGESVLAKDIDAILNIFQDRHGLRSIEYTPWGTVDPHHMPPICMPIAMDWMYYLQVKKSGRDVSEFEVHIQKAAERSAARLRAWEDSEGRERWAPRMRQDVSMGEMVKQ